MKNMEQLLSENMPSTPTRLETQSSNSVREYSDSIPVDLLIDIFSRVPLKSIARFRCVSKFLASILSRYDFTELFLTKSLTRPRLLFTLIVDNKWFFYSSPQPHNPHQNTCLVATPYQTPIFPKGSPLNISKTLCGLELLREMREICNPATGEFITLPKVILQEKDYSKMYLGYDPIGKQFKVLCMTWSRGERPNTHQVLTLESGKLVWRKVECKLHFELSLSLSITNDDICINVVLYFGAKMGKSTVIVWFDVRSEKFGFINTSEDMEQERDCEVGFLVLFNYKGKLGIHRNKDDIYEKRLMLWALEDAANHKWSKDVYVLSPLDEEMVECTKFVGMTGTGEIVYSSIPYHPVTDYYVVFYNMERKTFKRVKIEGLEVEEVKKYHFINTSIDYVENLEFT